MTLDDYYHHASNAGTTHLAHRVNGPALCGYEYDARGELVLDTDGGLNDEDVCQTCLSEVR